MGSGIHSNALRQNGYDRSFKCVARMRWFKSATPHCVVRSPNQWHNEAAPLVRGDPKADGLSSHGNSPTSNIEYHKVASRHLPVPPWSRTRTGKPDVFCSNHDSELDTVAISLSTLQPINSCIATLNQTGFYRTETT